MYRFQGDSKLQGFADLIIAGSFIVKGLRILKGKNGLFVGMPSQKGKDGQWYSAAYPLTRELKERINELVLDAFRE